MTERPIAATLLWRFQVGGAEKLIVELLRWQRDQGDYAPALVAFAADGPLRAEIDELDVPVRVVPPGHPAQTALRLTRLLRDLRPAVLHPHGIGPGLYAAMAGRRLGIPVVCTRHGQGVTDAPAWQLRLSVRWTQLFVGVSDDVSRHLRDQLGVPAERVRTVLNGVPVRRFAGPREDGLRRELELTDETFLMGTVARLDPVKEQRRMLQATRSLLDAGRDVALVIAGDGPEREGLARATTELDLAGRAFLLGPRDDIPPLLRNLDLFLLSSRTEGIPVSMLEAMASGVACVMTNVGGIGEVCRSDANALLVPAGDQSAFERAIARLMDDPVERHRIAETGRDLVVTRFSTAHMASGYQALYDEVRRPPGR